MKGQRRKNLGGLQETKANPELRRTPRPYDDPSAESRSSSFQTAPGDSRRKPPSGKLVQKTHFPTTPTGPTQHRRICSAPPCPKFRSPGGASDTGSDFPWKNSRQLQGSDTVPIPDTGDLTQAPLCCQVERRAAFLKFEKGVQPYISDSPNSASEVISEVSFCGAA